MGFQALASSNAVPFWQNVQLDQEIFAFYLSRDSSSTISVGSGSGQGGPEGGPEGGFPGKRNGMKRKKRQIVVDQGQGSGDSNNQGASQGGFQTSSDTSAAAAASSSSSQGQFTLGGLNESLYSGDINYSDVLSKSYW